MLQFSNVSKTYGVNTVLNNVSFVVNPGDRVGLVGPNGCGKSTILRIASRCESPDSGHVILAPSRSLGYLPQGTEPDFSLTVAEAIQSGIAGLQAAQRRIEELATQMTHAQGEELENLLEAYAEAQEHFESLGGYEIEHRTSTILAGLGLGEVDSDTLTSELSGGQKTRLGLARILLSQPNVLLLDEPTNHLDFDALEWLERFIFDYVGAVLIVSHDRVFLDRTVTRILELDEDTRTVKEFPGNYSDYAASKAQSLDKQWSAWKDQQSEVRRLEGDIRRTKEQALHTERATTNDFYRRRAKKVAQKAKARENRLRRVLDSADALEKPKPKWQMKLEFGEMPRGGQIVCSLDDLGYAFDGHWLFRHANLTIENGDRIVLVGPNGSGKTTLLKSIAGELEPKEGGIRIGAGVRVGYMPQEQEAFDSESTPLSIIRESTLMSETEARHFLHLFLFGGDDVFVNVNSLSYGERARLVLARIVLTSANLLVLDEPLNHLDIPSREQFQDALEAFPGTVLVASHDREFIDQFATGIWVLESGAVHHYIDLDEMARARYQL